MSDSELSTPANIPADAQIAECIRRVVRNALKADEEITVRIARTRAETELGLDTGFLKDDDTWKGRSKDIITAASEEPLSPELPKKSAPKKSEPKKSAPKPKVKAAPSKKRKSDEIPPRSKRQKEAATPESDGELSDGLEADSKSDDLFEIRSSLEPELRKTIAMEKAAKEHEAATSGSSEDGGVTVPDANGKPADEEDEPPKDDESDFSSVIDEPPPKKKRQAKSTPPSASTSKSKKSTKPAKAGKELTPDEEEMRRLQGWLVKCGIRKVWSKELAKFDTSKQKLKHLKGLLDDVGLTCRYSNEKAAQIKEARELAAEIEAAKEFNDQWGQKKGRGDEEDEEESEEDAKPRRLRPKGLVDFGDSGDECSD
ncbi:hypothetical protein B0A55_03817 [Friedmanniomyces simplex]|uniref:Uncharacterized protein n=1 Tax=Friedmanniomyces simplex TaxID=329884 RepID=A0A4U0XNB7_9PEZI|nr:hypothetical protein B0A55_03817 [Friedmanniomyces simplex]